jgi:hypothetical protein
MEFNGQFHASAAVYPRKMVWYTVKYAPLMHVDYKNLVYEVTPSDCLVNVSVQETSTLVTLLAPGVGCKSSRLTLVPCFP